MSANKPIWGTLPERPVLNLGGFELALKLEWCCICLNLMYKINVSGLHERSPFWTEKQNKQTFLLLGCMLKRCGICVVGP